MTLCLFVIIALTVPSHGVPLEFPKRDRTPNIPLLPVFYGRPGTCVSKNAAEPLYDIYYEQPLPIERCWRVCTVLSLLKPDLKVYGCSHKKETMKCRMFGKPVKHSDKVDKDDGPAICWVREFPDRPLL